MAGNYFDVGTFRKQGEKWRFTNDKGGWDIYLDALPMPGEGGQCRMAIVPQKERSGGGGSAGGRDESMVPF
jgi:hypothetical protein